MTQFFNSDDDRYMGHNDSPGTRHVITVTSDTDDNKCQAPAPLTSAHSSVHSPPWNSQLLFENAAIGPSSLHKLTGTDIAA